MYSLKPLAITLCLSTLFTMEIPFYVTPPAIAQTSQRTDCVLVSLAAAARIPLSIVADRTNFMEGPALRAEDIEAGLRILGLDSNPNRRTFSSLQELEDYLSSNGNAEYIVGWTRIGSIGHVQNASVNNREIRYIDNQAECESPNPAANPPIDAPVYYAWLTRRLPPTDGDPGDPMDLDPPTDGDPMDLDTPTPTVASLPTFLGTIVLGAIGLGSLFTRDVPISVTTPGFGNFTATCKDISLSTDFNRSSQFALSADCQDEQGNYRGTAITLDFYIVNNFGSLKWQSNGGFGASVQNCNINVSIYTVLTCDADNGRGSLQKAAINLDTKIENRNGQLTSDI